MDGADDRLARFGRADIAGDQSVALGERAAFGDAGHAVVDQSRVEGLSAQRAIARMIGELHGVDRPDLDAEALQGEDRGGVADMAVDDVGLDREDVHGRNLGLRAFRLAILLLRNASLKARGPDYFTLAAAFLAKRSSKVAPRSILALFRSGVNCASMSRALFMPAGSIRPVCE